MDIFICIIIRVFIFVAFGWFLKKFLLKNISALENYFVKVVYYLVVPLFIFVSIVQTTAQFSYVWSLSAAAIMVVFGGGVFAFILSRILRTQFRNLVLPVSIMNSAYLAIPVNTILFGRDGTFWAIIYNISVTIVHFTLGIILVKKNESNAVLWDIPSFYAVVFGFAYRFLFHETVYADFLKEIYSPMSDIVLPLMLVFIGMKITDIKLQKFKGVLVGVAFRILGGFLLGFAAVKIFGLSGTAAAVCLLTSSMPSAINTYIIAQKFDADPEFAAGMVLVGVALSAITIPLVSSWILSQSDWLVVR